MTSDCGASSHFIDIHLTGDIESRMKDIVNLGPPMIIVVAGHSTLSGVSMDALTVRVTNAQGFLHDMLLPAMNVQELICHLFPGGTAALKGVNTVIVNMSYLDVGQLKIPLRKDTGCPAIDYFDLELAPRGNYQTEAEFPTRASRNSGKVVHRDIFGGVRSPAATNCSFSYWHLINGRVMRSTSAFTVTTSFTAPTATVGLPTAVATATPAMPATAPAARGKYLSLAPKASERAHHAGSADIAETRANFTDSLITCDICKINKGTKQPIRNKPGNTRIAKRLQLVSTDLLGPVTPVTRANYRFMAKYSFHYTNFKAVYSISTKDKALTTLAKFVQDFVMPLELRFLHLRIDDGSSSLLTTTTTTARPWQSSSRSARPTLQSKIASANGKGARSWTTWPGVCSTKVRCQSFFGGKWQPPRCFYSSTCRTRPSAATRHTTGCSANASICPS